MSLGCIRGGGELMRKQKACSVLIRFTFTYFRIHVAMMEGRQGWRILQYILLYFPGTEIAFITTQSDRSRQETSYDPSLAKDYSFTPSTLYLSHLISKPNPYLYEPTFSTNEIQPNNKKDKKIYQTQLG
jgi:hypothetical protein